MPGSSTTPGHPGARTYAPVCIAFHLRNSVGTRDMNLCGAQWLAYVLPYRRFAAALTDACARLRVDVDRYSFIVSDLHRLLVAGLPAHCERICTLPLSRQRSERCIATANPGRKRTAHRSHGIRRSSRRMGCNAKTKSATAQSSSIVDIGISDLRRKQFSTKIRDVQCRNDTPGANPKKSILWQLRLFVS